MTQHGRITLALNHKEADKIPVDCGSMRSTGIMGIAYNRLKAHLGIQTGKTRMYDMVQQLAVPEQWYLDRFRIDSVDAARIFAEDENDWLPWVLPDGSQAYRPAWVDIRKEGADWICRNAHGLPVGLMSPNLVYFTQTNFPLMGKDDDDFNDLPDRLGESIWSAVTDPLWRLADTPDFYARLRSKMLTLRQQTDYAVMLAIGGNFFENGQFLYRSDEFLMNMLLQADNMDKLMDKLLELHLETVRKVIESVGDLVDVFQFGDDFGTQNTTFVSRELYRKFFFPRQKALFQYVHDHSPVKVFLHSCGAVYDFIPDFIEAGVDILNPVQLGAAGMDPTRLKREFGKDLVFWGGGIDTQHMLANGTPMQVQDDVRRNCEILMKDGGFVFNQVHNIIEGVPPENIIAMYDAVNGM